MANQALIESEWNQLAWGNFHTNTAFLQGENLGDRASRILEIGCGKGAILEFLRGAGHSVSGIDVDPEAIAECKAAHPELDARVASGDDLPYADASFDYVISFDVFEHILDSDRHLREVTRVLRPGGEYLLQTPNKWTNIPFEMLRQWKKFGTGPRTSYRNLLQDHCSLHSYRQLSGRFARHGYSLRFVSIPVVNDFFRNKVRTYMGPIGPALLTVCNPDRLPTPFKTNFYVRATRIS